MIESTDSELYSTDAMSSDFVACNGYQQRQLHFRCRTTKSYARKCCPPKWNPIKSMINAKRQACCCVRCENTWGYPSEKCSTHSEPLLRPKTSASRIGCCNYSRDVERIASDSDCCIKRRGKVEFKSDEHRDRRLFEDFLNSPEALRLLLSREAFQRQGELVDPTNPKRNLSDRMINET